MYRNKNRGEKRAYILLFTCGLTRVIYLLPDQVTDEFIISLKRLIARRDNAKTYALVSKWIKKISKSEILHHRLSTRCIKWKLNLSRAPWWGGQFERMVGLVKNTFIRHLGSQS